MHAVVPRAIPLGLQGRQREGRSALGRGTGADRRRGDAAAGLCGAGGRGRGARCDEGGGPDRRGGRSGGSGDAEGTRGPAGPIAGVMPCTLLRRRSARSVQRQLLEV